MIQIGNNNSLSQLSDETLLEAYRDSVKVKIDVEFLDILEVELHRRKIEIPKDIKDKYKKMGTLL